MKKLIFSTLLIFICLIKSHSQPLTYGKQSLGVSFGIPNELRTNYSSKSPSVNMIYDYGLSDKIGIGYISGGAMISFFSAENKLITNISTLEIDYSYTNIGPRASYHFDMVELTNNDVWNQIDVYSGLFLGLQFEKSKSYNPSTKTTISESKTRLSTNIFAGIRYSLTDKIGIFSELGFGINSFNFGINYRW